MQTVHRFSHQGSAAVAKFMLDLTEFISSCPNIFGNFPHLCSVSSLPGLWFGVTGLTIFQLYCSLYIRLYGIFDSGCIFACILWVFFLIWFPLVFDRLKWSYCHHGPRQRDRTSTSEFVTAYIPWVMHVLWGPGHLHIACECPTAHTPHKRGKLCFNWKITRPPIHWLWHYGQQTTDQQKQLSPIPVGLWECTGNMNGKGKGQGTLKN